jgi:hypothetical protein
MGVNNSASFLPKRNKNAYCIEVVDLQKMYLFCLSPPCHKQSYFKECLLVHEKWLRLECVPRIVKTRISKNSQEFLRFFQDNNEF